MATTLSGRLSVSLAASLRNALDLSEPADIVSFMEAITISDGAGANAANQVWHDRRTLAASSTDTFDLAGSLTNQFGVTVAFARVKLLLIYNETGGGQVQVRQAAANPMSTLFPGGGEGHVVNSPGLSVHWAGDATGWVVTAGSADAIRVVNLSGVLSAVYNICILGATS